MSDITDLKKLVLSALLLALTCPAIANDSIARVGVGGLALYRSRGTDMASEALTVSPKRINVRYRFRNKETDAEMDYAVITFPMPAFGWNPRERKLDANVGLIETFSLTSNGRAVDAPLLRKAIQNDLNRDITPELRKLGLNDTQLFRSFGDMTINGTRLSAALTKKLEELGAYKDGVPNWEVEETAFWQPSVPASSEITAELSYKPLSGFSYNNFAARSNFDYPERLPGSASAEDRNDNACLDHGGRSAVINRISTMFKQGAKKVRVRLDDVEYILGTGHHGKGSISDFKLDIVKVSPDQIVSTCFPGKATRVDDLTLRFQHKNFVPPYRVLVYFYTISVEK